MAQQKRKNKHAQALRKLVKQPGGGRKPEKRPCGWCKQAYGAREMQTHIFHCRHQPEPKLKKQPGRRSKVVRPCGWCGRLLTMRGLQVHFARCPRRAAVVKEN